MIDTENEIKTAGRQKGRLMLLLKLVITAVLILYLYLNVNPKEILEALRHANLYLIVISFILVVPNLFFQFYKWKVICNKSLGEKSVRRILFSLFYGLSAGIATPMRIGEYVGRAMVFREKGILAVTIATLMDKIFVFIVVTFLGAILVIAFLQVYYGINVFLALAGYIVIALLFYLLIFIVSKENLFNSLMRKLPKVKSLHQVITSLRSLKGLGRNAAYTVVISSVLLCLTYISQFAILTVAYSNQPDFMNYLWAGVMVMFTKTIVPPVTLGELGIREGASVFFLSKMGVSSVVALNASLTLFVFNLIIPSLIGLVMILLKKD